MSLLTLSYDLIGDVHGCHDELCELLEELGYVLTSEGARAPRGRMAVFLGDLVDRGPAIVESARLAMTMVATGSALCVLGNHEEQMLVHMRGESERPRWGLPETLEQLRAAPPTFTRELREFAESLPLTLLLDDGALLVAHAGLLEHLHEEARADPAERRSFALYGCLPHEGRRRREWAGEYRGRTRIVYGHTPTLEPAWLNRTICIDTGCVYGGALTALRYPELELVSVPAHAVHYDFD